MDTNFSVAGIGDAGLLEPMIGITGPGYNFGVKGTTVAAAE
jgi:hypothetical protein